MKKIISMGIASAVLALTAIAASADMVAATADKAVAGKDITVTITTTADVETFGFAVSATGLETTKDNVKATEEGQAFANVIEDGTVKVSGFNVGGYKAGTVLATITYTVTGDVDTDAVVALDNLEGYDEALQNLTVKVEAEGTTEPTEPGTSDPTEPGTEEPTDPSSPETGVALAVVPAVLAGAAVVVAKKRK